MSFTYFHSNTFFLSFFSPLSFFYPRIFLSFLFSFHIFPSFCIFHIFLPSVFSHLHSLPFLVFPIFLPTCLNFLSPVTLLLCSRHRTQYPRLSPCRWSNTVAGIRQDEEIKANTGWDKVPEDSVRLNYLMIGFDSLSRNTFIRTLPKTYAFLTKDLDAYVLQGYNIVGDGTPQQLLPILTGESGGKRQLKIR